MASASTILFSELCFEVGASEFWWKPVPLEGFFQVLSVCDVIQGHCLLPLGQRPSLGH